MSQIPVKVPKLINSSDKSNPQKLKPKDMTDAQKKKNTKPTF